MSLEIAEPVSEIDFDTIQQSFTKLKTAITDIQCQLRTLEKNVKKYLKMQ